MPRSAVKTLILDNYDSFTWNLFQLLGEINGEAPVVVRNDEASWRDLRARDFDNVVLSPGPGTPATRRDFGICEDALRDVVAPTLGVCLGHQGIGHVYGAKVRHAPEPMHGRISRVRHDARDIFEGVPQDVEVVRYHSLLLDPELPACLEKTAWTRDGLVMGVRHRELPLWGLQFHPESIRTEHGVRMLENFRDLTVRRRPRAFVAMPATAPEPTQPRPARVAGTFVVRSRRVATTATPDVAFSALFADSPCAFWLDSSRAETGAARFSFLGDDRGPHAARVTYDAATRVVSVHTKSGAATHAESIYEFLERELSERRCDDDGLPFDFNGGFVGYFGYELHGEGPPRHASRHPDAAFLFADRLLAFDHHSNVTYLVCVVRHGEESEADTWLDTTATALARLAAHEPTGTTAVLAPPSAPLSFRLERTKSQYLADIARCQSHIRDGESYEICLTNQIHATIDDALAFHDALRRLNPAPYAAFLRLGEVTVAGSSPERFLRIDRDGVVESRPIKGTRPRGRTPEEDARLRDALASTEKDFAENLMIVDLLRNDLGVVCEIGSVHVPAMMTVETYPTVHQLVLTIRGRLSPGVGAVACVRAAFPGGSMTGAPKIRTMQLLEDIERAPRGVYSGAVGYLGLAGTADLSIVIRTLVKTPTSTTIGVGGAIVALSDPEAEFEETLVKARALVHAAIAATAGTTEGDALAACERAMQDLREHGSATV